MTFQSGVANKERVRMGQAMVRNLGRAAIFCAAAATGVFAQFESAPVINENGQGGLEHTESAKTLGFGRLVIGAHGDMSLDNGFLTSALVDTGRLNTGRSGVTLTPPVSEYDIYPYMSIGIAKILDFSAMLPVYFDNINKSALDTSFGGVQAGIGDCELRLKLQVPPHNHPRLVDFGLSAGVSLPTGDRNHGFFARHSYYFLKDSTATTAQGAVVVGRAGLFSSGTTEYDVRALVTFNGWELPEYTRLMFHMNYGLRMFAQHGFDDAFVFNAGLEYHPAEWVGLFSELSAEPRLTNLLSGFDPGKDPLTITPGISLTPSGGLFVTIMTDLGLSSHDPIVYAAQNGVLSARVQPAWRLCASVGWAGFLGHSWHGGNEIVRNPGGDLDNDGIPDSIDKCPNIPEDKDGFEDNDGCPDYDNDKDGIPDSVDQCPNAAEDFDGFEDADGCPDPDNDKDGVCDPWVAEKGMQSVYGNACTGSDKCPNLGEDIDGFEDADGCPDPDNDLDGVPDTLDKCPNEAGPADNNGCPKGSGASVSTASEHGQGKLAAKEIRRGRLILKGVEFKHGTAELLPESYTMLDNVYESLKAYPEVRIELAGYTDNSGNPAANRKLSLMRAEKVREYLVLHGIDPGRISAVGRGGEDPIVDNRTPENRAFNHRIEMKRID
jgi:outer membrane protein OmpA-like peptidoglycan-associated protein